MMDRNAPEALRDTPQQGYDDTKALIAEYTPDSWASSMANLVESLVVSRARGSQTH
jgi:hypothetical protein